ncbi:MAG TPA: anti-sigma factor, partial [Candidatus Eisenbacteria bacterium]
MTEANFEGGHPGTEWLSAWHDGELQDEAAAAVRQHLDGCAACRHLLDEFRQLDQATRLADDATPDAATWEGIEGRLRQRLEDELGLGIPVGAAARYVETDAELVMRPGLSEVRGGKGARPFRLRWAVATAAGLGLGLFTLRTLSDNGWTVSGVMDPAARHRSEARVPARSAEATTASPQEPMTDNQADDKVQDGEVPPVPAAGTALPTGKIREEAGDAGGLADAAPPPVVAAPMTDSGDRYLADVEQVLRAKESAASAGGAANESSPLEKDQAAPAAARSAEGSSASRADADEAKKAKGEMSVEPEYAAVFAAASRARESGEYALARRGFALVAGAVPDQPLARDAEFEARLAGAHADIVEGRSPDAVRS